MLKNILHNKKIIIVISILLVVVAVVVTAVCLHSSDNEQQTEKNTNTQNTELNGNEILSGDSTFLVVVVGESNEIVYPFLADFKIYSGQLIVTPLSVDTVAADGRTYAESYAYGGINMLQSAVENGRNIDIDRYAVINKSGFNRLTELMGEVTLYINENFTYDTSDKTYTVTKGENSMGSDMLFTYISILAKQDNSEKNAAQVICNVINSYIENVDVSDAEKLFGDVTNCFSTDLTISDFYSAKNDIEYLINNGFECIIFDDVNV